MESDITISPEDVRRHVEVIFGRLPKAGFLNVRGIGEKGTDGEGEFREDKFIDLSAGGDPVAEIIRHVERWSKYGRASFIVPAVLSRDQGRSENVESFHSVVVDLDSGDIEAKHAFLEDKLGPPTAVVFSGGQSDASPKRHLYWTLNAPARDVAEIVRIRDEIARKGGGDMQFGLGVQSNPYGRAHQPVRIAGSIHGKNGVRNPVRIFLPEKPQVYGIDLVRERAMLMPNQDGSAPTQGGMTFAPERANVDLTEKIYEGGDDEKNRWSQFSRVCGHYIHTVRRGDMSSEEAKEAVYGWVQTSMVPPWPPQRVEKEWQAILQRDTANHGPLPEPIKPMIADGEGLEIWAAHRWSLAPKPERRFIVDGLILSGKHQLLVAEGGAGKTFLMLDLALKVASWDEDSDFSWCGGQVKEGGTVVILTTEDDKDELHIRLHDIDSRLLRKKAADRLIILPTINSGGSFAIVEKDPRTQEARPSRRWSEFFALLRRLPDLRLLVVDTLNSTLHGEENSATIINEFVRVASQVCGDLGAALILTHHIRKQGDEPIRNAEQMKAAVRGSSALLAAFRAGIGIWHCPDYDRRMAALGLAPRRGHLWKMAVIKANNPEMFDGEKTLLRTETGMLIDVTDRDQFSSVNIGERHAWLSLAIEEAARAGHPYSIEGKNAKSGLYRRRNELPGPLRQIGPGEFQHLVDDLLNRKAIVAAAARGGRDKKWLDVPTGPIASDEAGAEIASGAYRPPAWEHWKYEQDINTCVRA